MTSVIEGSLTAGSDLLFRSSRRRSNALETLPYVPGSTIRGAIARRWLERNGGFPDERFRRLFHSGSVRFHHARATIEGQEAFVAPLTLHADKARPFASDTTTRDLLLAASADDEGRLERVRADVTIDGVLRATRTPPTVVRTRIGTFSPTADDKEYEPSRAQSAQQGLAAEGQLFTEIRLAAGTQFFVRISGPSTELEQVYELLEVGEDVLQVGRSRTVMGHVVARWKQLRAIPSANISTGDHHTMTALSDLVLLDRYQRAITSLDNTSLAAMLGCTPGEVEILPGGAARTVDIGGWDGPNRMPTHIDRAIRAGSVVRFVASHEVVERLASHPWVGWRNAEGHGHVAVDWAVHLLTGFRLEAALHPDVTTVAAPTDELPSAAHRVAQVLAARAAERITPTVWSQVEDAVRRGEDLGLRMGPEDEPDLHDAQAVAGRGSGSGRRRRRTRRMLLQVTLAAFDGQLAVGDDEREDLGTGRLDHRRRLELVEHVGREVRLNELRHRERLARQRELGVQHHARRMPS